MIYNRYGSTDLDLSCVGFGGMRFRDQENVEECVSLVHAAYKAGINYFDTAPKYGKSEELFGAAFKEMLKTREERPFYVSTKTFGKTPSEVRADVEQSLTRMGIDYIDVFHMWCVMSIDAYKDRRMQGALKEMEKLRDEGLIRNISVSTHMTGTDVGEMLKDYDFSGVLLGYSAMNFPYRDAGISAAADMKKGVVVMNPLGGGTIPRYPEHFDFIRYKEGISTVEGALHFLFNDPRITVTLVGLSSEDELRDAVSAVESFSPIDAGITMDMRKSISKCFNEMCTGCQYCDHCPEGISVPKFMDSYNHYMLSGKADEMKSRLQYHWGFNTDNLPLDKCTACGACEKACTQKLPIIARLKEIQSAAKPPA